ncbi:DUF5801 repeats-in-toxin domain-containing protein, partial [Halomonas salifodinae]
VTLNTDPSDDNILIGRTESGNVAFIAVIVPSADGTSSDVYLLDYLPKQHLDDTDPDDTVALEGLFVNVTVEDTIDFSFDGAPSGNNDFMAFGQEGGVAIVVTGRSEGETVNSSQSNNEPTSLAANSNNINAGEGLVVTYVNMMDPDFLVPDLSGPEASNTENIQFGSLQSATEGSVTIVKVGPGNTTATVHLTALMTEQEEGTGFIPGIADDAVITITAVYVNDVAVAFTTDASGTVEVTGITNNDVITFETDGEHNRFKVENGGEGNARFNIGGVALADINTQSDADAITLEFDDDAPAVAANPTVKLDDDALAGGNPGGVGDDTDAENVSGTLGHDFGADGPGGFAWLTSGAPAGFSYALNGTDLEISQDGVGVVLTLTVDADGNYTVTQDAAIKHAAGGDENNQQFTVGYRVSDGDNDSADGSIAIDVDDDTPEVDAGDALPDLEVDESDFATDDTQDFSGVFAPSFGADGPAAGGGLSYALSVTDAASGLVDTLTGQAVMLAEEGGDIVGRNSDDDEVFRVSVDGAGMVTLDQSRAVVHPNPNDHDELITLAEGKIGLTATATDADDDSASLLVDISTALGFRDDGPVISPEIKDTPILAFIADASFSDSGFLDYGADGAGSFEITDFTVAPELDPTLGTITGSISADGMLLTLNSSEFGDFFEVAVDGSGTGSYTAKVLIDRPLVEEALIEDTTTPGGPVEEIDLPESPADPIVTLDGFLFTDPNDTANLRQTYLDGDKEIGDPDAALDDINISNKGAALADNQFDFGEGLALNFMEGVAGVRFIVQGGTGSPGADLTLKMAGYKDGNFVSFSEVTFTLPKGNAVQEVEFVPEGEVDQIILIHDATDNGFRIPEIVAFTFADIPDIEGTVTVEATDGDDDAVGDTFAFSIDGNDDGVITIEDSLL